MSRGALMFTLDPGMATVLGIASHSEECEHAEELKVPSMAWVYEELSRRQTLEFDLRKWPPLMAFIQNWKDSEGHLIIGVVVRDPKEGEPSDRRLTENLHSDMPSELYWPRWRNQWVDLQIYNNSASIHSLRWLPRFYRLDGSPVETAE